MTVNCLSCGHKVDLGDSYENYEGPIKCFTCSAILEIKSEGGGLRSVKFVKRVLPEAEAPATGG